jgi:L-alanine-DL-glutamate epimerase-like enolase superfamily enzyme
MRITRIESHLLRIPLERPITAPDETRPGVALDHVWALLVHLDTDAGPRGLGFAYALGGGGRALKALVDDDLAPLVVGEDPLDHERLASKVHWRLQGIGRFGLVAQAYSAIDLALWDLKGKAASLPLYKLLGGAREAAPVYGADVGWLWMSPDDIVTQARRYLDQGVMGIKMKIGHADPEDDARRLQRVFDSLGDEVWFAVDANQRYDYSKALQVGRFLDEDVRPDWFEEPLPCDDVEGHARLAERLETPIAVGETLFGRDEFRRYLDADAAAILQPSVTRLGGLTAALKVAALAEAHHRPLAPHVLPEVAVHLACGLPNVVAVEWMPWLFPAFAAPPKIVDGKVVPPPRPGLGLDLHPEAVAKYGVGA